MAINNTTPPKKPTGCGSPTAGAISGLNFPTALHPEHAFETMRAATRGRGHHLNHVTTPDGTTTYWAERWGLVRYLPTLHDAALFLAQIGGRL